MKVKITVNADLKGISPSAFEDCLEDLNFQIDETIESAGIIVTHPETDKEYELEFSVTRVEIEKA